MTRTKRGEARSDENGWVTPWLDLGEAVTAGRFVVVCTGYLAIAVKAMFLIYLIVIVVGCGACIVIGLVQQ